jgi:hypothetical protein
MPKVKIGGFTGKLRFARLNLREVTHGAARNPARKTSNSLPPDAASTTE